MMNDKKAPIYVVRPSCQFRQPFRFDFDKPSSRDFQNDQITYELTMNTYIKKLKLSIKTLDKSLNKDYKINGNELTRLNDQIPFDFGGFSNFYDPTLLKNTVIPTLTENNDDLVIYFLDNHAIQQDVHPLLEFIKSFYPPEKQDQNNLDKLLLDIESNLEQKYDLMMKKAEQLKDPKNLANPYKKINNRDGRDFRDRDRDRQKETIRERDRQKSEDKKKYDRSKSREKSKSRKKKVSREKSKSRQKSKDRRRSRERKQKQSKKRSKKSKSRSRTRSRSDKKKKYRS